MGSFENEIGRFYAELRREAENFDQCVDNVRNALYIVADNHRLGKILFEMDSPPSRLLPDGEHKNVIFYDRGEDVGFEPYIISKPFRGGGYGTAVIFPQGDEPFDAAERQFYDILYKEIKIQLGHVMLLNRLDKVTLTDLDTGLANSKAFMQYVGHLIYEEEIGDFTGVFFNIHNFKYINKVFTYAEGDVILKMYANKVANFLERSEMIARLGGDNFVALVKNHRAEDFVKQLGHVSIYYKNEIKEHTFDLSVTAGVAYLKGVKFPGEVMARTSIAYQNARMKKTGTVAYYTPELQETMMKLQSFVSEFPKALEAGDFVICYQPKMNLKDGSYCGAEALVRWNREEGLIPPMAFIPLLEREGSVCSLDYFVLEETVKMIRSLLDEGVDMMPISVNFSRTHFSEPDFVKRVTDIIDRHHVDYKYLQIEFTESDDFQDYEIITLINQTLKEKGIQVAIDDFGTGYSSINMLRRIQCDVIKIDKSFLESANEGPNRERDRYLFEKMIEMIHYLGMDVLAEGIETEEQLAFLKNAGCDMGQGFLFEQPVPQQKFVEMLKQGYGDVK